jgi:hypothetical protein
MTQFTGTIDLIDDYASGHLNYLQATGPNGETIPYCYQITGGSDGLGGITVSKANDGDSDLTLNSVADPNYHFQSVSFFSDAAKTAIIPSGPNEQFGYDIIAGTQFRRIVIPDRLRAKNGGVADFYYTLIVIDTRAGKNNQAIYCDPTIKNKQPF